MARHFTWLVWEFIDNAAARAAYQASPVGPGAPVPPPATCHPAPAPDSDEDKALRDKTGSASKINALILNEWGTGLAAGSAVTASQAPLVAPRPHPDWPSRP
jgi:hypothetical protein